MDGMRAAAADEAAGVPAGVALAVVGALGVLTVERAGRAGEAATLPLELEDGSGSATLPAMRPRSSKPR